MVRPWLSYPSPTSPDLSPYPLHTLRLTGRDFVHCIAAISRIPSYNLSVSTHNDAFADNDFYFACGGRNPLGLHLTFFSDGDLFCTRVMPKPHWQGFAGVIHGGLQSTIIDDLMSNHLFRVHRTWAATGEISLRFRRPVPIDRELLFISRIDSHQQRIWSLTGKCVLAGDPAARPLTTAAARFIEVPAPTG